MTTPYYDTRMRMDYSEYIAMQNWRDKVTGLISRSYSMSTSKCRHSQTITSYRGEINGSKGLMRQPKRHRQFMRRQRLLNPHPVTAVRYDLDTSESHGEVSCVVPATKVATLVNGLQYATATLLPSIGYSDDVIIKELPISRCYTNALQKQNPMVLDLNTNIGEIGETVRMLRNPLRGLSELLREMFVKAKDKRFRRTGKFRSMTEALSSTWLEYRYGIMPMVYTAVDLCRIAEGYVGEGFLVTKGSHEPIVTESVTDTPVTVGDFIVNVRRSRVNTSKATVIVTGAPDYKISALDTLGFRVTNLPFVALELATLSFVLEWFVDINGFLRQLIPFENRYIHNYQVCRKHSVVDTYVDNGTFCLYQGNQLKRFSNALVTRSVEKLFREVNPQIDVRLNAGAGISSLKRLIDSICLGQKPVLDKITKLYQKR